MCIIKYQYRFAVLINVAIVKDWRLRLDSDSEKIKIKRGKIKEIILKLQDLIEDFRKI